MTLSTLLIAGLVSASQPVATWDREIVPGMTFRMERHADPPLNVYGLRLDSRSFSSQSWLAGGKTYDSTPHNGRRTVSQMVAEAGAQGGVNGDFFQWGTDPGGAPQNLMISLGELLSHPTGGARGQAYGWGPKQPFALIEPTWEGQVEWPDGTRQRLNQFNGRVDQNQIGFSNARAGLIYSSAPGVMARLRVEQDSARPGDRVTGVVTSVGPLSEKTAIAPGEAVLAAVGRAAAKVEGLQVGQQIAVHLTVEPTLTGMQEAMGGGPILLRNGSYAGPQGPNEFADARHPRTAVGRLPDGTVWYMVIDGRQAMSLGASLPETAAVLQRWGCVDAINLDGGGSSAINALGMVLNRPSGGIERSVANGVVFRSQNPIRPMILRSQIQIDAPTTLRVGESSVVRVLHRERVLPLNEVVFAARGSVWITQDGRLEASAAGQGEVTVLVGGVVRRKLIWVTD
jgi:hypothetical protein